MALTCGSKIGPYEILASIGAGGMGEVFRAKDTRLDRDVAIKVLHDAVINDKERVLRFEREAKLLASLSHTNIAAIYGFEEQRQNGGATKYLVLEFVDGETLAARLKRGPLPVDEALEICKRVSEALEAAHEKGIVHRDLKPGNVMVKPDGTVKVLDFGLARAVQGDDSGATVTRLDSPTITAEYTKPGVVLGTAAYMSPEQARGRTVDKRSDIWSFGVILYECLTGEVLFRGETATDSLGAIMHHEPEWAKLPTGTPPTVQLLLRRCLTKDRNKRLRDIGDATIEIENAIADPTSSSLRLASASVAAMTPPAQRATWRRLIPWACTAILAVALAALLWSMRQPVPPIEQEPIRVSVELSAKEPLLRTLGAQFALSPDGTRLTYVAGQERDVKLYLRDLDQLQATGLSGTESASHPFFAPDGQWIGYFSEKKLMKVSVRGGAPQALCDVTNASRGGAWAPDGNIIFAPDTGSGLSRVPATGGQPDALTTLNAEKKERSHRWPFVLPDGEHVLFTVKSGNTDFNAANIEVLSLKTKERKLVHTGGSYARYLPTGYLVFVREATLFAAPFDLSRLELSAPPTPILEGVAYQPNNGGAQYAISASGTLSYAPGDQHVPINQLIWVDRQGASTALPGPPRLYGAPCLSPDGSRIAVNIADPTGLPDIWIYEISRGTAARITFDPGAELQPIWSPDGGYLVYSAVMDGDVPNLVGQRADGTGKPDRMTSSKYAQVASSWSPDGKAILFSELADKNDNWDIWVLRLEGEQKSEVFLQTPFSEGEAVFSPDGRFVAYTSDETGRDEVFVRAFPGPAGKWQVSTEGGRFPRWTRNGNEILYRNGSKLMSARVSIEGNAFQSEMPTVVFEGRYWGGWPRFPPFDVAPDGQRFIMLKPTCEDKPDEARHLTFVFNWFDELRAKMQSGGK